MRLLLRFFGLLFAAGTIIFVAAIAAAAGLLWHYSQSLPDYSQLQDYEPAVMTRVHASDGSLLAEYARERRLYIPIQAVSKLVIHAFVAAEDKNFYEHGGIDFSRIARAATPYIQPDGQRRRPPGRPTSPPAGPQELPAHQRGVVLAQDQGSAAGDEDRARLLQGADPRTLSQRNLSRHGRLRCRRRFAALFRQVRARAVGGGSGLSRGAPQGAQQLPSVPPARARARAAQLRARPHGRGPLHHRARGGEGEEGAAQGHPAADRRPHLRGGIFRRRGP